MTKGRRTEHFPTFPESFAVLCINNVDHGMAIIVIPWPDRSNTLLPTQIPELEDGGRESDLTHYLNIKKMPLVTKNNCLLFCPTVGAILSGVRPGTSLNNVFIFSSSVCIIGQAQTNSTLHPAYRLPSPIKTNNDDREFFFSIQPQRDSREEFKPLLTWSNIRESP
jgi:hypothetical protein